MESLDKAIRRVGALGIMIGSLGCAIILAAGNHVYYQQLSGQQVAHTRFNQQVNIAAGAAFAFLVRAALVIAVGTAYAQVLRANLLKRRLSVATIDSLSSLLDSVPDLLSLHLTWRHPAVIVLAAVSWLVPFATVVPPATLSVRSIVVTNYTTDNVPSLDFTRQPLYHREADDGTFAKIAIFSDRRASNLASVVAVQGELPLVPMYSSNSSYRISFPGPALSCGSIPPNSLGSWSHFCPSNGPYRDPAGYLSWIPSKSSTKVHTVHEILQHNISESTVDCDLLRSYTRNNIYWYPNTKQELFVAVNTYISDAGTQIEDMKPFWSLTRCELSNVTYTADFTFENGAQKIEVVEKQPETFGPIGDSYVQACHDDRSCESDPIVVEDYAAPNYLGVMNLIGHFVTGVISDNDVENGLYSKIPDIINTRLSTTDEFADLYNMSVGYSSFKGLDNFGNLTRQNSTGPLAQAMEELFQNLTLAMLTYDPVVSYDRQANVSTWGPQNIYEYSWRNLVLSYGIGILVAALSVVAGCFAVFDNTASYRNRFSTFLRTVHWLEVKDVGAEYDYDGSDPLPKAIAKMRLAVGKSFAGADGGSGSEEASSSLQEGGKGERASMLRVEKRPEDRS